MLAPRKAVRRDRPKYVPAHKSQLSGLFKQVIGLRSTLFK